MKLAPGFEMLELTAVMMGRKETIHPVVLWNADSAVLVDTGYPGQLPLLREAISRADVPWERLRAVVITHQDLDHIGSLPSLLRESDAPIEVLASEAEKPYIQGERRLLRLTPDAVESAIASLPPEVPEEWRRAFRHVLEHPPKAEVSRTVSDGEKLPYGGGLIVVATPGHTPGHLSLYHPDSRTLIAGDCLEVRDGRLCGPDPQLLLEPSSVPASMRRLRELDIATVVCYHGGLYRGDANRRIAELADELSHLCERRP